MATEALHYRRLVITPSQQEKLMIEVRKRAFNLATKSGYFIQEPDMEGEFPVRLIHSKMVSTKALVIDEERDDHLEFEKLEWQISSATDILFDFNNNTVSVKGAKSGFKFLVASLEEMDVNLIMEEVELDTNAFLESFRKKYTKSMVKSVGLKDYIAERGMKITGTFKATKDSDSLDFIKDHSANMNKWQLQCEYAGDKFKVTVTSKGDISISGEAPEEMNQLLSSWVTEHNLAAAVEVSEEEEEEQEEEEGQEEVQEPQLKLVPSPAPAPPPPPPAPVPQEATVG